MPTQRPFRFSMVSHGAASRGEWYSQARKAEHLGYAIFLVNDHLASTFAPVAAIIAAAEATTRLRVGSYVFANDFRHPVMLAKEAATIDVLSNGRFEFGIGTGWAQADYAHSGIPLDPPGVRVSRFAEAVHIIKGAFADAPISFLGTHYQVQDLQRILCLRTDLFASACRPMVWPLGTSCTARRAKPSTWATQPS